MGIIRFFVGTSGYSYKEWKGTFYPEKLPPKEMLSYYAQRFSTVELNNSFYRMPSVSAVESWVEQVPDSFRFVLNRTPMSDFPIGSNDSALKTGVKLTCISSTRILEAAPSWRPALSNWPDNEAAKSCRSRTDVRDLRLSTVKPSEPTMGAKTWMLVYADSNAREALNARPELDRDATWRLAKSLFSGEKLETLGDGDLSDTCPPDDELNIGCFAGVSVIAAKEFGIDYPSKLPASFIAAGGSGTVNLHAMHSVVDWFAYARWRDGKLVRSLSLSPDSGILEDIGQRALFEEPYWSGQHPAIDDEEEDAYPFPFHPLELGEAALLDLFGYQLEGFADTTRLEPDSIPLVRYKRSRSRWRFWR